MSGQALVDDKNESLKVWLREFGGRGSNGMNEAADRIEALEAELAEKREIIGRTWHDDYSTLQVEIVRAKHRAERAEQKSAELAAVIERARQSLHEDKLAVEHLRDIDAILSAVLPVTQRRRNERRVLNVVTLWDGRRGYQLPSGAVITAEAWDCITDDAKRTLLTNGEPS